MKYDSDAFARGLRVQMARENINASDIYRETKLSRSTISSFINGKSNRISFRTLNTICQELNCTPNELFEEVES